MDFESPDVMKDFPGLYSTEANKKTNDSDYSDDVNEKTTKKDLLIGKRKDKKDTKKDRGYAALEGESSVEEECESKSPSKTKKTKSFKFTTKTKEKREKNREKDKEVDKKREKDNRKNDRTKDKIKFDKKDRKVKQLNDDKNNIDDVIPIFGVTLQVAVERSRCHDGVELPLPVRDCIDYIQEHGVSVENVYKINGIKSKVLQIKKLYNQREPVNLSDYDVPTATSVLKLFLRELPEPVLGNVLTRFEEAAAIQNVASRETNLITLVNKLPSENRVILAWTILHLDTITNNDKHTKMNAQAVAMVFSPVLQMSHRLLTALLCHCKSLFKDTTVFKYCPPLMCSTLQLPEESDDISCELRKQESLLSQIHAEMNAGFISKQREELLWEVQRMITQLKRKLRSIQKCHEMTTKNLQESNFSDSSKMTKSLSCSDDDTFQQKTKVSKATEEISEVVINDVPVQEDSGKVDSVSDSDTEYVAPAMTDVKCVSDTDVTDSISVTAKSSGDDEIPTGLVSSVKPQLSDTAITLLQHQNRALMELKDSLVLQISAEKSELVLLKYCIANHQQQGLDVCNSSNVDSDKLDEIMDLLIKENRILKIKKIDLVREIMEQREACILLRSKLFVLSSGVR